MDKKLKKKCSEIIAVTLVRMAMVRTEMTTNDIGVGGEHIYITDGIVNSLSHSGNQSEVFSKS